MTKQECLEIIKLLSAMESWILAHKAPMPDHLKSVMVKSISALMGEVLK